jgi:hypothetical protein
MSFSVARGWFERSSETGSSGSQEGRAEVCARQCRTRIERLSSVSNSGQYFAIVDVERGITFTYAMNRMENGTLGNANAEAYVKAFYKDFNGEAKATL